MAHFVLEYSDNIDDAELALSALFEKLHDGALATGIFPLKGIRSRAYPCHEYRVADGNPAHMFVHLTVLIGAGRPAAQRKAAAAALFAIFEQHFDVCFGERGVAMSFELKELEAVTRFNRNNIADYL